MIDPVRCPLSVAMATIRTEIVTRRSILSLTPQLKLTLLVFWPQMAFDFDYEYLVFGSIYFEMVRTNEGRRKIDRFLVDIKYRGNVMHHSFEKSS